MRPWPHDDGPMTTERREALMRWTAAECIVAERADPDDTVPVLTAIAGRADEVWAEYHRLTAESRWPR